MNLEEKIQRIKELMISEELVQSDAWKSIKKTIDILNKKEKVLLLSCSNRYNWDKNDIDVPKSKMLAMYIKDQLGDKSVLIDVTDLKILPCEGNVSRKDGNTCGILKSKLDDKEKNPSGHHRCWASFNDKSDELWKISKELFESDLIEHIETGFICVGQNWNGENVTETQKKVHEFYGFNPNPDLYWNWQYTKDETDETKESYEKAYDKFIKDTKIPNQNEDKTN
jgi:hypothetical protein